jgi:hypothetical protein
MASVTVPSGNGNQQTTLTFGNNLNLALAQNIANAIRAAQDNHDLFVGKVLPSGNVQPNDTGKIGELFITDSGGSTISVPASANYSFVVDNSLGPDTIFGSPNLSIMGGGGQHTIVDPAVIAMGDDNASGGVNSDNITVTGAADDVAVGNGTNTLTGTGSGTLSGGFGANTFIESLAGSYLINSQGTQDNVVGGGGGTTVNASGQNASVVGGDGALVANITGDAASLIGGAAAAKVTASGAKDTIVGGDARMSVTLTGGASNAVVSGTDAALSVLDNGTSDTINAGQAATSITAPGGSFVNGGSGPLNFVGGAGPSTILGGSGSSTLFGGTGLTSVAGGAGGAVTYVNTTSGGLWVNGGTGDETIDASLSKGTSTIYGGQDTAGRNLLMGGAGTDFINAGSGSDTLVGGGGQNDFFFIKALGGPAANDVVGDFSAIDTVFLLNYGSGEAGAAVAGATTAGGSTTITLSDNTKITFTGVTDPAALNGHIIST